MTSLNLRTLKSASKGLSSERCPVLPTTNQTGDVADVSKEQFVGGKSRSKLSVRDAKIAWHTLMDTGTARSTTQKGEKFATNIRNTNPSPRNSPMIDGLMKKFIDVSEKRSDILKKIKDLENDILSITERIEEIKYDQEMQPTERIDAHSKARDKRKRVRTEIAEMEHEVRMHDAQIAKIKIQIGLEANGK